MRKNHTIEKTSLAREYHHIVKVLEFGVAHGVNELNISGMNLGAASDENTAFDRNISASAFVSDGRVYFSYRRENI